MLGTTIRPGWSVYAFPGGAGSVEANLRWQGQFKDADGEPPKIESKTVKGKNTEVTRVETAGHYKPGAIPGMALPSPARDARMLVAIVSTGQGRLLSEDGRTRQDHDFDQAVVRGADRTLEVKAD